MTEHFDKMAVSWDLDPMKIERSKLTAKECKKIQLKSRQNLLDFGGGTGLLGFFLKDHFEKITIADSSEGMLEEARKKIDDEKIKNIDTLKVDDISEINGKFSAIITLMTLHHIKDTKSFLKKASELIEDEGTLMIADLYEEDGSFHYEYKDYNGHNGFDTKLLSESLKDAGFEVSEISSYYEINKEISKGKYKRFPLFFLAAEKKRNKGNL